MMKLFCGYVVRDQEGVDHNTKKCKELNKIVIKKCIEYYIVCQKERKKEHYDEIKQRNRVLKQYKNIKNEVDNSVED